MVYILQAVRYSGLCDCVDGAWGKFCKHQAAIYQNFSIVPPNTPEVDVDSRSLAAFLAEGGKAKVTSYYAPLQVGDCVCAVDVELMLLMLLLTTK